MFLNMLSQLAIFATVANAAIRPDSGSIPRNTKSKTIEGKSQAEHTTDHHGRFKHPFQGESSDVQ